MRSIAGHADTVVVGAGAAGAPLAARLSADPGRRVVLIEAGPTPRHAAGFPPDLLDARHVPGAWADRAPVWRRPADLARGRPYELRPGRYLGGSTTVNGGSFIRARRADFERWAAIGGPAWSYDRVLPLLRRLENDLDFGASALHGDRGPMRVRRTSLDHPAVAAFGAAASGLGCAEEPDKNDQGVPGFGPIPTTAVDGVRGNTGLWYLGEALDRPNLTVLGECTVRRVVIERGRAVGVQIEADGRLVTVSGEETVLCAGALASPQLLMVSGIGPARELEALGISVVCDAPGVGIGVADHPQVVVQWQPVRGLPAAEGGWIGAGLHRASAGGDLEILQSLTPMADLVAGRAAGTGAARLPDAMVDRAAGAEAARLPDAIADRAAGAGAARLPDTIADRAASPEAAPLPFLVTLPAPASRGRLRLVSVDPAVGPRIDYRYLAEPEDRHVAREAVRLAIEIIASPAFREVALGPVGTPTPRDLADDRALDAWIASNLGSAVHACASVPMGPPEDPAAVVDQYGRVRGVPGLRVADTSILPDAPSRGPANTAVLIGELVADAIRAGR